MSEPTVFAVEGDKVLLRVKVARSNSEQSLIEIQSMEGPYSLRVPNKEIVAVLLDSSD